MPGEFNGGGSDSYTEVSHQNWFQRLFGSLFSGILGFVFFLASFGVIYWNEGLPDWSKIAQSSKSVNAASPATGEIGKFVAATGKLASDAKLGDGYLKKGNYVSLSRSAEMYAWGEKKETHSEKQVGGGEKTITEYSYKKEWTSSPESSSSFKKQAGHKNPTMGMKAESWKAEQAAVGKLALDMSAIELPSGTAVSLTDANTKGGDASGGYLYLGKADASDPDVGDERVSYTGLKPGGTVTVLGELASGTAIKPHATKETTFYRAFAGTREEALSTMSSENKLRVWGLRILGFLLCWGGMRMMLEPLNTVLDVLPFLGSMGRGLTGFATFPIAIVLTLITMIVSWITHSIIAMVLIGVVVVAVGAKVFGSKRAVKTA